MHCPHWQCGLDLFFECCFFLFVYSWKFTAYNRCFAYNCAWQLFCLQWEFCYLQVSCLAYNWVFLLTGGDFSNKHLNGLQANISKNMLKTYPLFGGCALFMDQPQRVPWEALAVQRISLMDSMHRKLHKDCKVFSVSLCQFFGGRELRGNAAPASGICQNGKRWVILRLACGGHGQLRLWVLDVRTKTPVLPKLRGFDRSFQPWTSTRMTPNVQRDIQPKVPS